VSMIIAFSIMVNLESAVKTCFLWPKLINLIMIDLVDDFLVIWFSIILFTLLFIKSFYKRLNVSMILTGSIVISSAFIIGYAVDWVLIAANFQSGDSTRGDGDNATYPSGSYYIVTNCFKFKDDFNMDTDDIREQVVYSYNECIRGMIHGFAPKNIFDKDTCEDW